MKNHAKKLLYVFSFALLLGLFYFPQSPVSNIKQVEAGGPATIYDGNSASSTAFSSQQRIVRTSNGTNGKRTFALISTTTNAAIGLALFYTDDPDAVSTSWSYVGTITTTAGDNSGDMVWDQTNNVIYIAYGKESSVDSTNSNIFYRRVSSLNGASCNNTASNCKIGAQQTTGLDATASISYSHPHITIASDFGFDEIILAANKHTNCGPCGVAGITVTSADLNSDAPSWDPLFQIKSWTASYNAGIYGMTKNSIEYTAIMYYDGANMLATYNGGGSNNESANGWAALDGTLASATTLSADDPANLRLGGTGSAVDLPYYIDNDVDIWFAWLDGSNDINTIRWDSDLNSLQTELTPIASATSTLGPALSTDGTSLWLVYQDETDTTKLVYQVRDVNDGTTAWNGTEFTLVDSGENVAFPSAAQSASTTLDVVYTTMTTNLAQSVAGTSSPVVLTGAATNVTSASAQLNGQITSIRGLAVTTRGFAWGTDSGLATPLATSTESGSFSEGMFSQNATGLLAGRTYYFRAYATNAAGTSYGSIASFTTGTDNVSRRSMKLFQGYRLKLASGSLVLHQQSSPVPPEGWCGDATGDVTCNTNWAYRRKITINNAASSVTLTDFPIAVQINTTNISGWSWSKTQDSGQDIRFVDPSNNGTALDHEIEKWDESGGEALVWVEVPDIAAASTTDFIWMYYGNASVNETIDGTLAWNSGYTLVYHMNDDNSDTTVNESTANNKDGTKMVSASEPAAYTSGKLAGALDFDGTGDRIEVASPSLPTGDFSYSVWAYADNPPELNGLFLGNNTSGVRQVQLRYDSSAILAGDIQDNGVDGTVALSHSTWYHLGIRRFVTAANVTENGVLTGAATIAGTLDFESCQFHIGAVAQTSTGCAATLNDLFDGRLDELRVSNVFRSNDWIEAEYLFTVDSSKYTYASEESQ